MGNLKENTPIEHLLTHPDPRDKTVIDIVKDADDAGIRTLTVTMERTIPVRCETPPRQHDFRAMEGFIAYLHEYGGPKPACPTTVLCDPITGRFVAILDENHELQTERITFTPQPHPAFQEWQGVLDKPLDFPTLAAFVQRQRRTIENGPVIAKLLRQIKASTKVELLNGAGKDAVNGITWTTKIQGVDKGSDAELPETLRITVPLYLDAVVTTLDIDLNLETRDEGKKIVAVLSAPTLKEDMWKALLVYAEACKEFQFGFGVPQYGQWAYQPQ